MSRLVADALLESAVCVPLLAILVGLLLFWLLRPESFRRITPSVPQSIPADVPTGKTVFIDVPAYGLSRMEMFYRTAGNETNPAVLLIHGMAGSSDTTWFNTYAALQQHYYIIAPDLRGHGLTMQPPGPLSIEQMAEDVYALMSASGIQSAHVVGHSLGGLVAMQLTLIHPEVVDKLVLLDTSAGWGQGTVRYLLPLYPYIVRFRNRIVGWQYENWCRAKAFTQREVASQHHEWIYQKRMFNQTEPFIAAWKAMSAYSALKSLPTLRQSTLIIYGEHDNLVSMSLRQQLVSAIPNAEMVTIANAFHYPQIGFADQVNSLLLRFLAEGT